MERTGIQDVYEYHHHVRWSRGGMSVFKKQRSAFLREHIGVGKRILDIGCRDGTLTKLFSEGNSVLGLDIDERSLARAREEVGIEIRHVDLNGDWGLEPESFDVVVAGEVLEHLYYPDRVMEKARYVLKPGGMFIGSIPNAFTLKNRLRLLFGIKNNTPLNDPTHINQFSWKEFLGIMKNHFSDVELKSIGRFSYLNKVFPGMFAFIILFVGKKKKDISKQSN